MNPKKLIPSLAAIVLTVGFGTSVAQAGEKSEAKLLAEAKITKEAALKTALEKVPDGKLKEAELENEDGKLIWSFDLATPGTKDTTEVNVDAKTGKLVGVEVEKAKDEANEEKDNKNEKD